MCVRGAFSPFFPIFPAPIFRPPGGADAAAYIDPLALLSLFPSSLHTPITYLRPSLGGIGPRPERLSEDEEDERKSGDIRFRQRGWRRRDLDAGVAGAVDLQTSVARSLP